MFNRIVSTNVEIPSSFSTSLTECIQGLLIRDEDLRLGSGDNGSKDIMRCNFFVTVDFVALLRREVRPPFKPNVANDIDTKYVPKFFLDMQAVDSINHNANTKNRRKQKVDAKNTESDDMKLNFEAFTYHGDRRMDG